MNDTLGDAFIGYNEWVIQKVKVEIVADFVNEYHEDTYEAERGAYIAGDVKTHTSVFSIPLDARLTAQRLQEIKVLQKIAFSSSSYPSERTIKWLLL